MENSFRPLPIWSSSLRAFNQHHLYLGDCRKIWWGGNKEELIHSQMRKMNDGVVLQFEYSNRSARCMAEDAVTYWLEQVRPEQCRRS